jgi:chlorite dismutase
MGAGIEAGGRPVVDHSAVAETVNAGRWFAMHTAFKRGSTSAPDALDAVLGGLDGIEGLQTRGWYDLAGYRADADALVWWWAPSPEPLQAAYRAVLDAAPGAIDAVFSAVSTHRVAEFNRGHVPAFLAGDAPLAYACVYPFVRGREWYLLPDEQRRELLREHGAAAKDYGDVLANTTSAFGLGDVEWMLAFESDDVVRIVDLIRDLRATDARRYVLLETPFFTGPRADAASLLARMLV